MVVGGIHGDGGLGLGGNRAEQHDDRGPCHDRKAHPDWNGKVIWQTRFLLFRGNLFGWFDCVRWQIGHSSKFEKLSSLTNRGD